MKVIIEALKLYQDIYKRFNREECQEINQFIQLLKSYDKLNIEEFSNQLGKTHSESKKVSHQQIDIKNLGNNYYGFLYLNQLMTEELETFLEINKDELFIRALTSNLEEAYHTIEYIDLKKLKTNQLKFLGYALVDIEVRGKSKIEQKKYLLQHLWKAIENRKMNGIYEDLL